MTLTERLADAKARSVALYLRRQQIEAQRQHMQSLAQQCDMDLMTVGGEVGILETLVAEEAKATKANG